MINPKEIKDSAERDFEKTWISSSELLPRDTKIELTRCGKSNSLRDMVEKSRQILLSMGFDEVENRSTVPVSDVYLQYGPEAPVILDRSYYLATLPRPDIGLEEAKVKKISSIIGEFNPEVMQTVLRDYKRGKIEGDNFVDEMIKRLGIKTEQATEIMEAVFPELKLVQPVPTDITLRSHMTGAWYGTLSALQDKSNFPLALFSVGARYRNEQKEDEGHLRIHHSASVVIMDPNMSLEAGRDITKKIMQRYGFGDVKFEKKAATSKYYANGLEEEVFVQHNGKWVEIADIGMYSPISLANFDIKYPVFNAGFGIERMVLVLEGTKDIRKLVYPQFYGRDWTDRTISSAIEYVKSPLTARGREIAAKIIETAKEHKDAISPCRFTAYQDQNVKVELVEDETGQKLIGPAGMNYLCVRDGNVYQDIEETGTSTGKSVISGIANAAAYEIERGNLPLDLHVKTVKGLAGINLFMPPDLKDFLNGEKKRTALKGYVFVRIKAEQTQNAT